MFSLRFPAVGYILGASYGKKPCRKDPFLPSDAQLAVDLAASLLTTVYGTPLRPWLPRVDCRKHVTVYAFERNVRFNSPRDAFQAAVNHCNLDAQDSWPACALDWSMQFLHRTCRTKIAQAPSSSIDRDSEEIFGSISRPSIDVWSVMEHFSDDRLQSIATRMMDNFLTARPFAHVVIDDFLPWQLFNDVEREIPMIIPPVAAMHCAMGMLECTTDERWHWLKWQLPHNGPPENFKAMESYFGPASQLLLSQLRSSNFVRFLERLTGIAGLLPDPLMWGGGMHQTARGGYLSIHLDFANHPQYAGLQRRVNLFLYLDGQGKENFGGDLELWEQTSRGARCRKRIRTRANRIAIFAMSPSSWHGHPWPLQTPSNVTRRSLALYYYTSRAQDESTEDGWIQQDETLLATCLTLSCKTYEDPVCYGVAEMT